MERTEKFMQAYRAAWRDCIQIVHEKSASMNDPHARQVLNALAFDMGFILARIKRRSPDLDLARSAFEEYEKKNGFSLDDIKAELGSGPNA